MLSLLLLSVASFLPQNSEPQPAFAAANIFSVRAEALVGEEGFRRSYQLTSERPDSPAGLAFVADDPTLAAFGADSSSAFALSDDDGASDDANGCAFNGDVQVQVQLNGANAPDVFTYVGPFICPDGTTVQRTIRHTVIYRTGTKTFTYGQSSPKPGVVCPPVVVVVPFTEISSESWEYLDPACPNSCCVLKSTTSTLEYNLNVTPGPVVTSYKYITCPDGSSGIETTTYQEFYKQVRWVTKETYDSNCPDVACPPSQIIGAWHSIVWESTKTVTTNCPQAEPM